MRALLRWYSDMGIDTVTGDEPAGFSDGQAVEGDNARGQKRDRAQQSPNRTPSHAGQMQGSGQVSGQGSGQSLPKAAATRPNTGVLRPQADMLSADEAVSLAKELAAKAQDLKGLEAALRGFEGCPLKKGARNTVFADGTPGAPLLVMGEAPGRDEDREGVPFIGKAGLLLDKMLGAIGHDRTKNAYISNVIYWRPPGNRTPTDEEMMMCHPFAERLIELAQPKVILIAGAAPLKALLHKSGIMKSRGKWHTLRCANGTNYDVMPTFHPAYLLRNPQAKRQVWQDLQAVREKLREN